MNDNAPTSLHCPTCGAPLDVDGTRAVVRCKFCGNVSLIPGIPAMQADAPAILIAVESFSGLGTLKNAYPTTAKALSNRDRNPSASS
jgi:hypothetical protein